MKKRSILILILLSINLAAANTYQYEIKISNDNGILSQNSEDVIFIENAPTLNLFGNYYLKLTSTEEKILYETRFNSYEQTIIGDFSEDNVPDSTLQRTELEIITIQIPYFENASKIEIYDSKDAKILEISLNQFSREFDPSINQNPTITPENLPPTTSQNNNQEEQKKLNYNLIILISVLTLLIAFLIISVLRRPKAPSISLKQ
ncbi:MAG: hypothetical protein IH845_03320 [Nanoarchaeota archaeon]|nr:hypothetical protein [Nanoarchaeota archaeon]